MKSSDPLIRVTGLKKYFTHKKFLLKAVDDVSFEIYPGETLGLVGESGCGKTTIGRSVLGLYRPTEGSIFFGSDNIFNLRRGDLKHLRKEMQMIFQDPYSSLNPRLTVEETIEEPFKIHTSLSKAERFKKILELLAQVGLSEEHIFRFPHEFSGGQRQRIGIARALALNPKFIVCDEPIAALDVSIQAQIINLLKKLQEDRGLTYLFISHDLSTIKYLSSRVAVMYLGRLVEIAPSASLYQEPLHPYTLGLLSSIPIPDPRVEKKRSRIFITGEVPSPIDPPKGCVFCTRCPKAMDRCHRERPLLKEIKPGHFAACHLHN